MYTDCTECEKPLSKEDIEINKDKYENYFYPICDNCAERYTDRVLDIVMGE